MICAVGKRKKGMNTLPGYQEWVDEFHLDDVSETDLSLMEEEHNRIPSVTDQIQAFIGARHFITESDLIPLRERVIKDLHERQEQYTKDLFLAEDQDVFSKDQELFASYFYDLFEDVYTAQQNMDQCGHIVTVNHNRLVNDALEHELGKDYQVFYQAKFQEQLPGYLHRNTAKLSFTSIDVGRVPSSEFTPVSQTVKSMPELEHQKEESVILTESVENKKRTLPDHIENFHADSKNRTDGDMGDQ